MLLELFSLAPMLAPDDLRRRRPDDAGVALAVEPIPETPPKSALPLVPLVPLALSR